MNNEQWFKAWTDDERCEAIKDFMNNSDKNRVTTKDVSAKFKIHPHTARSLMKQLIRSGEVKALIIGRQYYYELTGEQ